MQGDLDDFVNEGAEAEEVVEAAPEPEKVEEAEKTEPEAEEKGEKEEATATPAEEPEDVRGLKAALKAERKKRQAAERAHQQQVPQFDPSVFYQDPASIQSFVEQQAANTRFQLSHVFAQEQYADYEEMEELFIEAAENNPGLIEELRNHPAPALYAYKTAKQLKTVKEAQDGSLEARIRAEVEAKLRAEFEAKAKQSPEIPTDLASARSSRDDGSIPDESLESILTSRTR